MTDNPVMTTNEVAVELGTDPKHLRKFFRSDACTITPVGQGKRYAITADDIEDLKTSFKAWSSGKAKKADDDSEPKADKAPTKAPTKKARGKKATKPAEVIDDEEDLGLDYDGYPENEPTKDSLDELDGDEDLVIEDDDEPEY